MVIEFDYIVRVTDKIDHIIILITLTKSTFSKKNDNKSR
jgi:hypothetical protein